MPEPSLFESPENKNGFSPEETFYQDKEFKGLNLSGAVLREKEFYKCSFTSCNFFKAKFISCEFEDCTFSSSDLSLAIVTGSKFLDVMFKGSKTAGIDWRGIRKPYKFNFIDSKIDNSIFYRMDLRGIKINKCSAVNVDFVEADLTKAVFKDTDLTESKFSNTNLTGADFSEAFSYRIDPNNNKFGKTLFSMPEAVSLLNSFDIIIK